MCHPNEANLFFKENSISTADISISRYIVQLYSSIWHALICTFCFPSYKNYFLGFFKHDEGVIFQSPSRISWQKLFTKLIIVSADHKDIGTHLEFLLSVIIKFKLLKTLFLQYMLGHHTLGKIHLSQNTFFIKQLTSTLWK